MNTMSDDTRNSVNEAAVMQSISQNSELRDYYFSHTPPISFQDVIDKYPNSQDPNMQILRDYVANNPGSGSYEIRDYHNFGDGKGYSVLVSAGDDVYVGFDGTGRNGWIDNGEGLCEVRTELQQQACNQFDYYATSPEFADIMNTDHNIVVTGHSKGGNKAMYVTMNSEYGYLINSCVSMDGQGFSPEAIEYWNKVYGENGYSERAGKIISISGQNDFVHELGISIVKPQNQYIVDYQERNLLGKKPSEVLDILFSFHKNNDMFSQTWNWRTMRFEYTSNLNRESSPGIIEPILNEFMAQYMRLGQNERKESALAVMTFFQKAFGGKADSLTKDDIDGIVAALLQTSLGLELVGSLATIIAAISPLMAVQVCAYFMSILERIKKNKREQYAEDIVSSIASHEILFNTESFVDMRSSFDETFDYAIVGAVYAKKAEIIKYDSSVCEALVNTVNKKSEDMKDIMRIIVDSFTATDSANARAARTIGESYLGSEIYAMVQS